jgi:hypothetical protein
VRYLQGVGHEGRYVDGQVRLGVALGAVDALGVARRGAVVVDEQHDRCRSVVLGREGVGGRCRATGTDPVVGRSRCAGQEHQDRQVGSGIGEIGGR